MKRLNLIVVTILSLILMLSYTQSLYALEITTKTETRSITFEDPSPDYFESSEYMIGSVAVGVIFMESNGTIDPSTEDWTSYEESGVTSKIQSALEWWSQQNQDANVSFTLDIHYGVPTSYEPINTGIGEWYLWINEASAYLGYPNSNRYKWGAHDYINALRHNLGTDWSFVMFIVDASNDDDGLFPGKIRGHASIGGPYFVLPVKRTQDFDWVVAHEATHMFWATDEYDGLTQHRGYLNVTDIDGSGCIMDSFGSWRISGKPDGLEGTWGQIGWRDSDGDGIQDIVDTFPRVYLNLLEKNGTRLNCTGVATVTPHPNIGKFGWIGRDVTINKIKSVEFRVNEGEWLNATVIPTKSRKQMKSIWTGETYIEKTTTAIVNFTFLTTELEPGEHFIEIRARNQWGNEGVANSTIRIPETLPSDLNGDGEVDIRDITIVALAFGCKPSDENWNAIADLNEDEVIDIRDVTVVALEFGKTA